MRHRFQVQPPRIQARLVPLRDLGLERQVLMPGADNDEAARRMRGEKQTQMDDAAQEIGKERWTAAGSWGMSTYSSKLTQ